MRGGGENSSVRRADENCSHHGSSEIVALRFRNLNFARQVIRVDTGRMPRFGGIEAEPKTGPREVDCSYDPTVFALLTDIRKAKGNPAPDDYVLTDPAGQPLSQEWLHKRIWLVTLRRAELRERGQYNIRDSFISIALSAGEDPGWVAKVCGTSEEMIFRHYRTWIPGLNPDAGVKVGRILSGVGGGNSPPSASPVASPTTKSSTEAQRTRLLKRVEAGGIEPPSEGLPSNMTTCLAVALISLFEPPAAGSRRAIRFGSQPHPLRQENRPIPLNDILSNPVGESR